MSVCLSNECLALVDLDPVIPIPIPVRVVPML